MTEAMNEQNEFRAALDKVNKNYADNRYVLADDVLDTIRRSLEFMAANHEALRAGNKLAIHDGLEEAIRHNFTDAEVSDEDDIALNVLWRAAKAYQDLSNPNHIFSAKHHSDDCIYCGLKLKDHRAAAKLSQGN